MSATRAAMADYTGKGGLGETLDILGGARLVIGNETGVIHLAAAARTPSVCVLGGGHYGVFLPYPEVGEVKGASPDTVSHPMDCFGCDWRCIFKTPRTRPAPCITNVSVDSVWEKTLPILNRIRYGALVS